MNVLKMLDDELKNKNWSLEEKARYLYLRSCELFSYDPRYFLSPQKSKLRRKIASKTINLENVDNFDIICFSYANYILPQLWENLLNLPVEIIKDGNHAFNRCCINQDVLEIDPTFEMDLFRVKMSLNTYGYNKISSLDNEFYHHLRDMDTKIDYIEDNYEDIYLTKYIYTLFQEFSNSYTGKSSDFNKKYFIYRLQILQELFQKYKQLKNFYDAQNCIEYLQRKLKVSNDFIKIPLFHCNQHKPWDFINIYFGKYLDYYYYFVLEQQKEDFSFHKINKKEAKWLVHNLEGKYDKKLIQQLKI